ncbi:hypothetical protein RND71_015918 [Anisodus tanguticus]|uniref:Uncharacterized protein n=1 Tax=Anisodus tanguticus TaxID=243964 RepID=A0AAE1S6T2_9SOLA|nr:hypothetical protein RND71_015918 [Anisodus tanguticus]
MVKPHEPTTELPPNNNVDTICELLRCFSSLSLKSPKSETSHGAWIRFPDRRSMDHETVSPHGLSPPKASFLLNARASIQCILFDLVPYVGLQSIG